MKVREIKERYVCQTIKDDDCHLKGRNEKGKRKRSRGQVQIGRNAQTYVCMCVYLKAVYPLTPRWEKALLNECIMHISSCARSKLG